MFNSSLISIFLRCTAQCTKVHASYFPGWNLIFGPLSASMCLIQVAKGRTDLHARSFLGNLCLRHSLIFFQCHKPCGSPTTVGTCSTKWKFLLFCFYLELHEWAFPLWQTQHTLYSIFLSLFHTQLLSWMQNPDFVPGNTEQWVYTREGNLIPSSPGLWLV